jgi:hypothetical protein
LLPPLLLLLLLLLPLPVLAQLLLSRKLQTDDSN